MKSLKTPSRKPSWLKNFLASAHGLTAGKCRGCGAWTIIDHDGVEEPYDAVKAGYAEAVETLRHGEHPARIVECAGRFRYLVDAWNQMQLRYGSQYLLPHDCERQHDEQPAYEQQVLVA